MNGMIFSLYENMLYVFNIMGKSNVLDKQSSSAVTFSIV